ncbi:MBL fold metallo-hydrolase [uncultured Paludibaculum sp.]|uniref:MBL fold metallo-hydrolase n=1 Tax=uncultured Paludibaculum sp. TaxID=1765020 RepID=UPI002AABAA3B|nr:MBL fold metallo-hydrolase [uncultured Paludibaculum sp.]
MKISALLICLLPALYGAQPPRIDFTSNLPAKGTFPKVWIHGSKSLLDNHDPPVQVHWFNEHTVVMRENKAYNYEAAFMYLYFGNDRAILLDQGSTALRSEWPLRDVVDKVIAEWCRKHGRQDIPLVLAFSHLHGDHWAAQNQFIDRPNTRIMGLTHEEMVGFWGMKNYPEERVEFDLGGRKLLIWGSPGHVEDEFAYYDTYTQILFTGDMFYRGYCYITYWDKWMDSMARLMQFADKFPIAYVVGCHVEMKKDGSFFTYGTTYQPDEAPVQMDLAMLRRTYEFAKKITKPGVFFTGDVYLCNQTRMTSTLDVNPYVY